MHLSPSPSLYSNQTNSHIQQPEGIIGENFLHGIQAIIGADPNVPADQVKYKPFMGSFANVKSEDDPALASTSYCLTDNACGHFEAYSQTGVSLSDLGCNKFCFIDKNSKRYVPSAKYTIQNPPKNYLCCGWETC